jgi:chromosomal replication initiation ATPase DnaA
MGQQLRLELGQPTCDGRESFIVSPANAAAVRAVDSWPAWPGGCLALIGPEGSGKTHLARAWAVRAAANILRASTATAALALARIDGPPVLIEDADRGVPDDALFHLINMATVGRKTLLLTGRTPPSTWRTALPDLRSRLNALPVAQLPAPDDAILEGVLINLFRERNIKPAEDLIPYLLRRIERSVGRARQVVAQLDEAADAEGRAVSRGLARQILEIDGDEQPGLL